MNVEAIELDLDITDIHERLAIEIESHLQQWGEPLRWAITSVDLHTNIARIEAIVIIDGSIDT